MPVNSSALNKIGYVLIISLLNLSVFLTLFIFRSLDDNRLTSWQWTFTDVDIARFFFILILGIIIAYALSKVSFPECNPAIFLFLSSFVISVLFWKEPEVIIDASRYFTQAKHLKVYGIKYFIGEWGRNINAWTDLPLVPFLYGLIFKFFGESRTYIQIFTTSLFSMTVVLTYLIGKTLWDKNVGFFAGVLLLGIPYLFTQVPLMLVDVSTMFFLTFLIFAFIKALERGKKWIAISSVAIFLVFFSKYSTWLMLSVLVVIVLVYLIQNTEHRTPDSKLQTRYIYRSALVALIAGFFIGFVILFKFDVFSGQINLLLDYQKPGLKRWGESFVSTFFYQIHPLITIAALYSIYVAFKKRDLKYLIISWLIFLIVLLQIKRIRYIIIIFPMLTLMASYGLQVVKNKELRRFVALCIVVSSLVLAIFVYLPFLQKMSSVNLKNAGRFLDSVDATNIEVLTPPSTNHVVNPAVSVPILDLFTEKDIYYHYDTGFSPPFKRIKESPLRFTWEYKNPEYYSVNGKGAVGNTAIVVISSELRQTMPDYITQRTNGFHMSKIFKDSVGVFKYVTIIKIYQQGQEVL